MNRWLFSDCATKVVKNIGVSFNIRDPYPRLADHNAIDKFQGPSFWQRFKTAHDT
jgi:hypothetical protein